MDIKAIIEQHPYLIGSAVVGTIVVFAIYRSNSASSEASTDTTTVSTTPSGVTSNADYTAELQAATQAAANQNAAILQQNQITAELQAKQIDAATTTTANQLAAQVQMQGQSLSADVQNNANNFAYQSVLSNNATQLDITKANDATQLGVAQLQAQSTQSQNSLLQTIIQAFTGKSSSGALPSYSPANTISPVSRAGFATPTDTRGLTARALI